MTEHGFYQDSHFIVKYENNDFRIYETCLLEECNREQASHAYLRVTKSGMTTLQATQTIASQLEVPLADVAYAGRKDEEGVSEQYMTVPLDAIVAVGDKALVASTHEHAEAWMNAVLIGFTTKPLDIGELAANTFKIVLRRVQKDMAAILCSKRQHSLFYINYYDTQRFGMPDRPKLTHQVGDYLAQEKWQEAFDTVLRSGTEEARHAQEWKGNAAGFFASLEPRSRDFFLAARESSGWNNKVSELVLSVCGDECIQHRYENLHFVYPVSSHAVTKVATECQELSFNRYDSRSGTTRKYAIERPTVSQVPIRIEGQQEDEHFSGYTAVTLSFTLPQGGYATMVLRQLELQLSAELKQQE